MHTESDRLLAHNIRDLITRMNRRLRKHLNNPEQLSVAELNVLAQLITEDPLLPSGLCAQLKLSSQFMSQVLNRLETIGYVARNPSLTDKRKSLISLTEKGKLMINDHRQVKEEWLTGLIASHYSEEEKALIQKAITLLSILPDL